MRKRDLENKKLDEIGRMLVRNGAMLPGEIERVIARPGLFDSVRTRIALTEQAPAERSGFSVIYRRNAIILAGCIVTVTGLAFAISFFRSEGPEVVVRGIPAASPAPQIKRSDKSDEIVIAPLPEPDRRIRPERISMVSSPKPNKPRRRTVTETRPYEGDFYALSYAGDPNETDRGARIIRVDMPRSALFAMGINIPLENETEMVKTDLLVGTDGVTRAIRVVK